MRWITKSHLHLDRVATPWLIVRFVDPDAEFAFLGWDDAVADAEAIPFGVADVELSAHDERGTCFHKVLLRYGLTDPALAQMERIIASGVADALGLPAPSEQTAVEATLGAALNQIGTGMGLAFGDEQHLKAGMALYEAIFALCQMMVLSPGVADDSPARLPERLRYLREAVGPRRRRLSGRPGLSNRGVSVRLMTKNAAATHSRTRLRVSYGRVQWHCHPDPEERTAMTYDARMRPSAVDGRTGQRCAGVTRDRDGARR